MDRSPCEALQKFECIRLLTLGYGGARDDFGDRYASRELGVLDEFVNHLAATLGTHLPKQAVTLWI